MTAPGSERAPSIKDGDIFRWRYKDEKPEQLGAWGRYHCKSRIAIAKKDGRLIDTFWCHSLERAGGMDCAQWTYEEAGEHLELTLLGNLAELEKRPEYHANYYDDADYLDLNHSNSSTGNFYVRKGAQRSRDKMRSVVLERMTEADREIARGHSNLERHRAILADIDGGKSLDEVYL